MFYEPFHLGPLRIAPYGIMVALGLLAAIVLGGRENQRIRLMTPELFEKVALWTVLWGAAFVLGEAEEIRFDIIYSKISETARRAFTITTGTVLIVLYGISLPATYSYVSFMKVERSAYLQVPINWMYSVYVLFAVASICRYAWLVWLAIRGTSTPEANPATLGE